MKRWQIFLGVLATVLATLACGGQAPVSEGFQFWTATPEWTQTPIVVVHTGTPLPTLTPVFVEITNTPIPSLEALAKCVMADVTVHLRPSPNTSGYPIEVLANGQQVLELGGRVGKWLFVSVGKSQGWIDSNFLTDCG